MLGNADCVCHCHIKGWFRNALHQFRFYDFDHSWYARSDYERLFLAKGKDKDGNQGKPDANAKDKDAGKKKGDKQLLDGHFAYTHRGIEGVAVPQQPPECIVLRLKSNNSGWYRGSCINSTVNEQERFDGELVLAAAPFLYSQ